jgi:hypothetical protein
MAWLNFSADFADPFTMINQLLDPSSFAVNLSHFNDSRFIQRMR